MLFKNKPRGLPRFLCSFPRKQTWWFLPAPFHHFGTSGAPHSTMPPLSPQPPFPPPKKVFLTPKNGDICSEVRYYAGGRWLRVCRKETKRNHPIFFHRCEKSFPPGEKNKQVCSHASIFLKIYVVSNHRIFLIYNRCCGRRNAVVSCVRRVPKSTKS